MGILTLIAVFVVFQLCLTRKPEPSVSTPQLTNKLVSQEKEEASVTVTVKPEVLKIGQKPKFQIEFNTHSVDLSFDITKISLLVDDKGNIYSNAIWNGSDPGGHHRSGTLSFNNFLTGTTNAELIIRNIAGVAERKFKWNL